MLVSMLVCNCVSATEHLVNMHIIDFDKVAELIYRVVPETTVTSKVSRMNASIHSEEDVNKRTETYSLDHCHNPSEKASRHRMTVKYRHTVKTASGCDKNPVIDLNNIILVLLSDPIYIRIAQHRDGKKMIDQESGKYVYHHEFKHGAPMSPKKMNSTLLFPKTMESKTMARKVVKWLRHASNQKYLSEPHYMSNYEAVADFMFGTSCNTTIMEVIIKKDGVISPALMFYDLHTNHVIVIEVNQDREREFIFLHHIVSGDTFHAWMGISGFK